MSRRRQAGQLRADLPESAGSLGVAGGFFLTLALGILHLPFFGVAAGILLVAALVNASFYVVVLRSAGLLTALAAIPLHQLYYVYGAATFVWCVVESRLGLAPAAPGARPSVESERARS